VGRGSELIAVAAHFRTVILTRDPEDIGAIGGGANRETQRKGEGSQKGSDRGKHKQQLRVNEGRRCEKPKGKSECGQRKIRILCGKLL